MNIGGLGTTELIIVAAIILLFFGSKKLKELARGLGESTKEVKKIGKELKDEGSTRSNKDKEVEDL